MNKILLIVIGFVCVSNAFGYYQTKQGRFLSRDPIAEKGGDNLYGYVANQAINYIDILGLIDTSHPVFINPGMDYMGEIDLTDPIYDYGELGAYDLDDYLSLMGGGQGISREASRRISEDGCVGLHCVRAGPIKKGGKKFPLRHSFDKTVECYTEKNKHLAEFLAKNKKCVDCKVPLMFVIQISEKDVQLPEEGGRPNIIGDARSRGRYNYVTRLPSGHWEYMLRARRGDEGDRVYVRRFLPNVGGINIYCVRCASPMGKEKGKADI